MTAPYTRESLLELTKSKEGLETLNIIGNQFSNPHPDYVNGHSTKTCDLLGGYFYCHCQDMLPLVNSLDALAKVEEKIGLHESPSLAAKWESFAHELLRIHKNLWVVDPIHVYFLKPSIRLIIYILTAQWKTQNP